MDRNTFPYQTILFDIAMNMEKYLIVRNVYLLQIRYTVFGEFWEKIVMVRNVIFLLPNRG